MKYTAFMTASALLALALCADPASAQSRGRTRRGGPGNAGAARAVPRGGPPPRSVSPRNFRTVPYRPYIYGYGPGFRMGVYSGYGYGGYGGFGHPYGSYAYGYPYGYAYPSGYSSYDYGYSSYYRAPARGYLAYGGVRIRSANRDAEVMVDGYYVGIVDDFDGVLQQVNLDAGPHHIEVRTPNAPPIAFDVNVLPGQTITYRADQR